MINPDLESDLRLSGTNPHCYLSFLDNKALHDATEIAADIGQPRHRKARAIRADPGIRVDQYPITDRLAGKTHGEVGIEKGPLPEIQHGRGAVAEISVEAVIANYFDGLYEGDADKLGAVFHPSADLRWLEKGELQVLTVPDLLERVRKRLSAKAEGKPRKDRARILSSRSIARTNPPPSSSCAVNCRRAISPTIWWR
jgi:hypothetical protein